GAVGTKRMAWIVADGRVVGSAVDGIGERGWQSQVFTPRVCRLTAEPVNRPQRNLGLHRMVVAVADVVVEPKGAELRIRCDEVFGESVQTQHSSETLLSGQGRIPG